MEEFKISLGLEIKSGELDNIKSQINGIKVNPIDITLNMQGIQSQINTIKTQIQALNGTQINLGGGSNTGAQKAISDYSKLMSLQKRINSTQIKLAGLDTTKNSAQIKTLTTQLNKLTKEYNLLYKASQGKLSTAQMDNLRKSADMTADKIAEVKAKLTDALNIEKKSLSSQIDVWMKNNTAAAKQFGGQIESLRARLKTCDEMSFKGLKAEFQEIIRQAQLVDKATKTFGGKLKDQLSEYGVYLTSATLISAATQGLRSMYDQVVEIDTAMTNLKKVTDETDVTYQNFLSNAGEKAQELGRSVSSFVEQTANWAKMGYGVDEAAELAKVSSIYANVADVDDATAVSDIVTAMKAFNIEAENAITVIDPLNKLSNEFAVTAAGLGQGLTRAASTMASSGTDLEHTLALLTGISEITQSPEEAGNFLKTAVARIRGMKGELEALGEEVDESVDSISKVQTQILNLTHGKVNIFDDNGEFRDYYEIIKDISEVVDELESTERAQLYEILFGKNRMNQGAAMIQAFQSGQIEKAFESATKAAGSAMAEQAKWADSLKAKLGELSAAWQDLSQTVIDSDFLKGLIDGLTEFINIIDTVIEDIGVLNTLLLGFGGYKAFDGLSKAWKTLGVSKLGGLQSIDDILILLMEAFPKAANGLNIFTGSLTKAKGASSLLKGGLTVLKGAFSGLWAVISAHPVLALVGAFLLLGKAINALSGYNASEKASTLRDELIQEADAVEEEVQQLDELIAKYKELAQSETQDASTRTEIRDIQNQIVGLVGGQAANLDLVNGKLDDELAKLLEIQRIEAQRNLESQTQAFHQAKNASDSAVGDDTFWGIGGYAYTSDFGDTEKEVAKILQENGYRANVQYGGILNSTLFVSDTISEDGMLTTAIEKAELLQGMIDTIKENYKDYASSDLYNGLVKQRDAYLKDIEVMELAAQSAIDAATTLAAYDDSLSNFKVDSVDAFDAYRDKLIEKVKNNPDLSEVLSSGIIDEEELEQSVTSYLATLDEFSDYYNQWCGKISEIDFSKATAGQLENLKKSFGNSTGKILSDSAKQAYDEYKQIVDKINELEVDSNQTVFGNVDLDNRQVLEWTEENLKKYDEAIKSWEMKAEELKDSFSTVLGSSSEYGGIEIAFTPILQTSDGAVLLSKGTVDEYINSLISNAGEGWTAEDIIKLDAQGLEIDGQMIKGLIADIGDTAIQTGEAMHYLGSDGALAGSFAKIADEAKKAKVPVEEFFNSLQNNNEIQNWFDNLSDKDKQLVYEISVKSDDTTLWTLTKWKQELESMATTGKTTAEQMQEFYNIMNGVGENDGLGAFIEAYTSKLSTLQDSLSKIDTGALTDSELTNLVINFPELAPYINDTEALKNALRGLIDTSNEGINEQIQAQIDAWRETAPEAAEALEAVLDAINALPTGLPINIDDEIEKFNNLYAAISESVSAVGLSSQSIKNMEAMFSGLDTSKLFERTEHGIHLNVEALRDLQSEYENTIKLNFKEELQDLKQEYIKTKKELDQLYIGTDAYNKKLAELDNIENQINKVSILATQYEGLTSSYNKWTKAQSAGEEGDMYDNITSSMEGIKELHDKGLVGTNEYVAALQLMTDQEINALGAKQREKIYQEGSAAMSRYFTEGSEGCLQFLKDVNTLNKEWASVDKDGNWEINFGIGNDEEIAKAISGMKGLELSTEQVQIIMRKLSDYGFDINLDSAYTSIENIKTKVEETEAAVRELGVEPVNIDIYVEGKEANSELDKAKTLIQEIKDKYSKGEITLEVHDALLKDAYAKVDALVKMADQPVFMSIDVNTVDEELQEPLTLLQQYQEALDNYEYLLIIGADDAEVAESKKKVDAYIAEILALNPEILIQLGIDPNSSQEEIQKQIQGITEENFGGTTVEVTVGVTYDLEEANDKLFELGKTNFRFDFDSTNLDVVKSQIVAAKDLLDDFKNEDGTVNLSLNGAAEAQLILEALITQKQELSAPAIMTVDTSGVTEASTEVEKAIKLLQDLQTEFNNYEISAAVGADTTEAENNISNIISQINALPDETKIALGLDDAKFQEAIATLTSLETDVEAGINVDQESIDIIISTISAITPEMIVEAGVDPSLVEKFKGEDHDIYPTAHYGIDDDEVENFKDENHDIYAKIHYSAVNTAQVNGTANVQGTAFAQGNWGTKDSGVALGGELGQEVVVRGNRYFTIGDNGAEFFRYQKGDIIFNHKQTEELFRNGKITSGGGRGRALANGTAYAEGTAFSSGGGFLRPGSASSGSKEETSSSSSKGGSNSSSNSSADEFKETFDWIEIAIDRIERAIDKLDTKANSIYKKWSSRNENLKEEISKVREEIALQQDAYERYMKEAESVGLDESWAKLVRDGAIDITTITDSIEALISDTDALTSSTDRATNSAATFGDGYKSMVDKLLSESDRAGDFGSRYYEETGIAYVGKGTKRLNLIGSGSGGSGDEKSEGEILAEKIQEYQEWYEKALDCQDAIEELKEKEAELYKQSFDNVIAEYEGYLSVIEYEKNMLEERIAQSEAKGYIANTEYYEALIEKESANIAQLEEQREAMYAALEEAMLSGTIEVGSEAWQEMCQEINDVTLSIEEANTAMIEYGNSIREIEWQIFDLLQEKMSQVTQEADFLINLLSSDKLYDDRGQLTDEGMSTMGLHGMNYNTYMAQADKYAEELLKIDKQIAEDPYNQDLIDRRQELLELQQEMILAAEDEKEAIVDMVREGIELELDSLKELIDAYTEALDSQKDLYNYQKKIQEQIEEITSLEKQMSSYKGDNSEETKAKLQQLKVSLEEARENLEETEYERFIQDSEKLLNSLYEEYELILNQRLDNVDALITDMIAEINTNASTISDTLSLKADEVGYILSDTMISTWDTATTNITDVLTTYGSDICDGISSASTTLNNALALLNTNIVNMVSNLNSKVDTAISTANNSLQANNAGTYQIPTYSEVASNSNGSNNSNSNNSSDVKKGDTITVSPTSKIYDYAGDKSGERQYYRTDPVYTVLDTENGYVKVRYHDLNSGVTGWFKENDIKKYATGVYNLSKNKLAWTQEEGLEAIIRPSDGAILTPLAKGDSVLKASATSNIFDFANDPSEFIIDNLRIGGRLPITTNRNIGGNTYDNDFDVQIVLPNVMNYEQFKYAMQHDPKFEKMVRAMTVDKMFGGSSLKKYKC